MQCRQCSKGFRIQDFEKVFYEKIDVPEPTWCPPCRSQQRLAHWPFGVLRKRKCDLTGETIISTFPVNARFPVYKRDYWFQDNWNPPEMDISWNRPFLDQLYELQCKTPHFHQLGRNNENCDYADDLWDCKNVYLSRSAASIEDMYYIYRVLHSKNCVDVTYSYNLEQCYECVYCFGGFNLMFSSHCRECSDSYFLYDCHNCKDCFMCWNLRSRQYVIFNKQYAKEEYREKILSLKLSSRKFLDELKKRFREHLKKDACHRADWNVNIENCTGNYITRCKNCQDVYFMENCDEVHHSLRSPGGKVCMDISGLYRGELCYEVCQSTDLYGTQFAHYSVDCKFCRYIDQCFNSQNLFGCVGLKRREYCILNKQYTREEYEALVPRLIEHMKKYGEYGEFFPYKFAYNGFNLSLGAFYFQETEESIKKKGGFFEPEPEKRITGGIDTNTLPDLSGDISDSIMDKPINCAKTGHVYAFVKPELDFYRFHKLPLPVYCPEERHCLRFAQLMPPNPRQLTCFDCKKEITTYYPEYFEYEKILCEDCYLKKVY